MPMSVSMMPQEAGRPNPIQFEIRSIENREESQKAGHYVGEDVIYVRVHQPGQTTQVFEAKAESWIESKRNANDPHYDHYQRSLENFKKGHEAPVNGTAVKDWPPASPTQVKVLHSLNVFTVEDLADITETAIGKIGPGARALKQKAEQWIAVSESTGQITERLSEFEVRMEEYQATIDTLLKANKELQSKLDGMDQKPAPKPAKIKTRSGPEAA